MEPPDRANEFMVLDRLQTLYIHIALLAQEWRLPNVHFVFTATVRGCDGCTQRERPRSIRVFSRDTTIERTLPAMPRSTL